MISPGSSVRSVDDALRNARPVFSATYFARLRSGTKRIGVLRSIDSATCTAFDDVQQMSDSAFTSAVEFTYATTFASGYCAFSRLSDAPVTKSAIGQPARRSGISTVFVGDRIFAVSAMK